MEDIREIGWLAVLLATCGSYVLGGLWFTPLFGRMWDRSIGYERTRGRPFGPAYYVVPLVCSFVASLITAALAVALNAHGWTEALLLGAILGVGFAVVSVNNAVAPNVPHPFLFGSVVGGYHLTSCILVAMVVVGMR